MRYTIPIAVLVCLLATDLLADDTAMLQQWLERRIVPVDQTHSEVQSFVESRLPPLALPGTVDDWQAYAQRIRQQVLRRGIRKRLQTELLEAQHPLGERLGSEQRARSGAGGDVEPCGNRAARSHERAGQRGHGERRFPPPARTEAVG